MFLHPYLLSRECRQKRVYTWKFLIISIFFLCFSAYCPCCLSRLLLLVLLHHFFALHLSCSVPSTTTTATFWKREKRMCIFMLTSFSTENSRNTYTHTHTHTYGAATSPTSLSSSYHSRQAKGKYITRRPVKAHIHAHAVYEAEVRDIHRQTIFCAIFAVTHSLSISFYLIPYYTFIILIFYLLLCTIWQNELRMNGWNDCKCESM